MRNFKNETKIGLLRYCLLIIIIFGMLSTTVLANLNYQTTLAKGTEVFTVSQYNETEWKATINQSATPSDWFEGDTNITGAQSKITVKGWNDATWETYDIFFNFFMVEYFNLEDIIPLLGIMETLGYNETNINANYTNSYDLWYGLRAVWNFTTTEFEDSPSYNDGVVVFRNPLDFKTVLDDYNEIADELNGKFPIQMAGYNFPILNADEFIWQLVLDGLAIAKPQSEYLENLINELGCENVTVSGSTMTINRNGVTDYTVVISYGEKGTMSSLLVKDIDENIIFRIVSTNFEWIFYIILIVIAVCAVVFVVFIIVKKRKPKI